MVFCCFQLADCRCAFSSGFFARSSYRFRRSLKHRLLASQIAAKLLLASEDRHPDRRKLPFQCARDLGVIHLFVVAQHERHLLFSGQPNQPVPPLRAVLPCAEPGRAGAEGVEWSGTSISSVPSTHAPFSRFLCRSLSMQCRPVHQDFVQLQKRPLAAASSASSGCRKKRRQTRKTWR